MVKKTEVIKAALRKQPRLEKITPDRFLSSGSTLVNLACTGEPNAGFLRGHYYLIVGDSDSGKTFLSLTCFAEATINDNFSEFRLIYDAPEGGALMDLERFFGPSVAKRLESPEVKDGEAIHSQSIEEFYFHVDDALKMGKPFVYVLDSQDCLSSKAEEEKFKKTKGTYRKQRRGESVDKEKGSYGDGKAKAHSSNLRRLMGKLRTSGSILIIINQTRDSFDMFEKSTYSGGRALKFYATLQLWLSKAGALDRQIKGKKRQLGIVAKVRVKKNRVTGRDRTVLVPLYHSCGIDDIGGCIDYLVAEGVWDESDSTITAIGLGPEFSGKREALIQRIYADGAEEDLRDLVAVTWQDIEKACEVRRKSRYS